MASALDPPGVLPSLATAFPQTQAIAALGRLDGLQKGEWVQPEDLDADLAIAVAGLREDVPFKPLDLALSRVLLNAFKHSESPPLTLTKTWDAPLVTDTQRHLFMGLLGANPDHVPDVFLTSRTDAIEPQFPESALTFALRKNNGQQWLDLFSQACTPQAISEALALSVHRWASQPEGPFEQIQSVFYRAFDRMDAHTVRLVHALSHARQEPLELSMMNMDPTKEHTQSMFQALIRSGVNVDAPLHAGMQHSPGSLHPASHLSSNALQWHGTWLGAAVQSIRPVWVQRLLAHGANALAPTSFQDDRGKPMRRTTVLGLAQASAATVDSRERKDVLELVQAAANHRTVQQTLARIQEAPEPQPKRSTP